MQSIAELTPRMLARFTQIDYDKEMALIAVLEADGRETEIAVTRYVTNPDGKSCEFAIVVADEWQQRGIAHRLMERLMETARNRSLEMMEGEILANNQEMLRLAVDLGFTITLWEDDPTVKHVSRRL